MRYNDSDLMREYAAAQAEMLWEIEADMLAAFGDPDYIDRTTDMDPLPSDVAWNDWLTGNGSPWGSEDAGGFVWGAFMAYMVL